MTASTNGSATPVSPTESEHPCKTAPPPFAADHDGKTWLLEIGQQPIRARMCGFGDKDRRPISPPPCIQLIIKNSKTNEEIDLSKLDLSLFVLTVDLWNDDADKETNLVKHATNSPSISSVSTAAYPRTYADGYSASQTPAQAYGMSDRQYTSQSYVSPTSATPSSASSYSGYLNNAQGTSWPNPGSHLGPSPYSNGYAQRPNGYTPNYAFPPISSIGAQNPYSGLEYGRTEHLHTNPSLDSRNGSMYTRNLIGNLSASAFRLKDQNGKEGIWFVMQDLSIRTEGWFRLKFSFVNLGRTDAQLPENGGDHANGEPALVRIGDAAPVLASCFSKEFKVWSAKKFPGVIESTELSKTFATQGIKIPIRKEVKEGGRTKRKRRAGDSHDESSEEEDD